MSAWSRKSDERLQSALQKQASIDEMYVVHIDSEGFF